MAGWIKLHRSLTGSAIAAHPEYLAVWVHLMLRAQHSNFECVVGRGVVSLSAGQLIFGRIKFSAETGISENKVRAAIDVLKSLKMITIKSMAKFSIISITNWHLYQDESPANNHETAIKPPASNHQTATYKNVKNVKNVKNDNNTGDKSPVTLVAWLEKMKSEDVQPIPVDDPIFQYADDAGIPNDWLRLCWIEFKTEFTENGKRQKDWRAHFRNFVRKNYYKLWWLDNGQYQLTSRGQQAMAAMQARMQRGDQ